MSEKEKYLDQLENGSEESNSQENNTRKLETAEVLKQVPKRTGYLYYDESLPYLTNWNEQYHTFTEWYNLKNTDWYKGSFIKNWYLEVAFEKQNLKVVDFDNWEYVTSYLKEMFIDYKDQYKELFSISNWRDIKDKHAGNQLSKMISSKWPLHDFAEYEEWIHTPFSNFQGFRPYIHLPIRLNGEFLYAYIARGSWWFWNNTDSWWHLLANFW